MAKIILLASLLPTVVVVLLRRWFCDRVLGRFAGKSASKSGRELAEWLLDRMEVGSEVELIEKRRAGVIVAPPRLVLSPSLAQARDVVSLGEVALLCGHALVAARNPDLLKWRQWAVRFGMALPVFTLIVMVFAKVVGKVPMAWGIAGVAAALGLASVISLATVMIERESSRVAAAIVDESRFLPRLEESEAVAACCKALAYRHIMPGAIEWIFTKRRGRPIPGAPEGRERIAERK